jgi:K+-transporting ATPase c subunit
MTESPQFLCFGERRINVLMLNLELDKNQVKIDNK